MLWHTTIDVDGRQLDLLLTEEEVARCFERCLAEENRQFIGGGGSFDPDEKPPCGFWAKILGAFGGCDH